MKTLWRWLVYWYEKAIGKDACPPDCPLCAANRKCEEHYERCGICLGPSYPCAEMEELHEAEQRAIDVVFPELRTTINTTASNYPVQVFPPWDLSK